MRLPRLAAALGLLLSALTAVAGPAAARPDDLPAGQPVTVQTWNLDLGADLRPLFGATDFPSLQVRAAGVYANVVASRPEERMQAVARIVAGQRPDVLALQEVALWSLAPWALAGGVPVPAGPYQPSFDFLRLLQDDLAHLGQPYDEVSTNVNFDSGEVIPLAVPISATAAARYTDRNVILVRRGSRLQAAQATEGDFAAHFEAKVLGQVIPVRRGWASVDLSRQGRTVRVIDTHLEAYGDPPLQDDVRNPQAVELAGLASASPVPTLVVGDLNARPSMCATWRQPPVPEDANTVAYATLQAVGLAEAWPLTHPDDPCAPASWTSSLGPLDGPGNTLSHRIDDVFLGPGLRARQATVVGDTEADRSVPNHLWPSDHASTVAVVQLAPRSPHG